MACDLLERHVSVEVRLQDHGGPQDLVQRREERHAAVVAGTADQVDVRLCEFEGGDDLQPVGDVYAVDGVERHPRDAVAFVASERGESVGDPARPPAEGCEVMDAVAADDGRLVRQRSGVIRQEIETHGSDPRSGWGSAKAWAWASPSTKCCWRDQK